MERFTTGTLRQILLAYPGTPIELLETGRLALVKIQELHSLPPNICASYDGPV